MTIGGSLNTTRVCENFNMLGCSGLLLYSASYCPSCTDASLPAKTAKADDARGGQVFCEQPLTSSAMSLEASIVVVLPALDFALVTIYA